MDIFPNHINNYHEPFVGGGSLFFNTIELDKRNVEFIMSNANVDLVRNAFKDFDCIEVIARRAINSKNPSSTTTEVLITNIVYQHSLSK